MTKDRKLNHGIINKNFLLLSSRRVSSHKPLNEIKYDIYSFAQVQTLKHYFSKSNSRNVYYIMLKNHVAKQLYRSNYRLHQIADVLNLKNHATILHHVRDYKQPDDYSEFIDEHFERCIAEGLYPKPVYTDRIKDYSNKYPIFEKL